MSSVEFYKFLFRKYFGIDEFHTSTLTNSRAMNGKREPRQGYHIVNWAAHFNLYARPVRCHATISLPERWRIAIFSVLTLTHFTLNVYRSRGALASICPMPMPIYRWLSHSIRAPLLVGEPVLEQRVATVTTYSLRLRSTQKHVYVSVERPIDTCTNSYSTDGCYVQWLQISNCMEVFNARSRYLKADLKFFSIYSYCGSTYGGTGMAVCAQPIGRRLLVQNLHNAYKKKYQLVGPRGTEKGITNQLNSKARKRFLSDFMSWLRQSVSLLPTFWVGKRRIRWYRRRRSLELIAFQLLYNRKRYRSHIGRASS